MPPAPRERSPEVPLALDAICRRALAFRRDDRYPTALAMQQEIDDVLETMGRPSARRIGAEVTKLFEDRRTLTRSVIERQLAHLTSESRLRVVSLASSMPPTAIEGRTPSNVHEDATARMDSKDTRVGVPDAELLVEAGGESSGQRVESRVSLRPLSRRAKLVAAALVGMTFAGVAMAGVYATVGDALVKPNVRVSLRATPDHARFRIDDGPALPNPYDGELSRDDRDHKLVVEADGYPRRQQTIRLSDDVSMRLILTR